MTWTLFWQIFILINVVGFWVGVTISSLKNMKKTVVNNFSGSYRPTESKN